MSSNPLDSLGLAAHFPKYRYFSFDELVCKCGCGRADMDYNMMIQLEQVREVVDVPFRVTSAFRCPEYNMRVSTTGLFGPHTTGKAIDIACDAWLRARIMEVAYEYGARRFGVAKNFVHLDWLLPEDGFPAAVWSY